MELLQFITLEIMLATIGVCILYWLFVFKMLSKNEVSNDTDRLSRKLEEISKVETPFVSTLRRR